MPDDDIHQLAVDLEVWYHANCPVEPSEATQVGWELVRRAHALAEAVDPLQGGVAAAVQDEVRRLAHVADEREARGQE